MGVEASAPARASVGGRAHALSEHRRGQLYALAAALSWSTGGILQRQIHAGAADQIVGRACFAFVAVMAFVWLAEGMRPLAALRSVATPAGLTVAAGIAAASATFILALNHTTVAHVLVLQAVTPLVAGVFAFWALREPLSGRTLVAMGLAAVGIGVMVGIPGAGGNWLGDVMALLSPLSFAVVIVVARRHRHVSMAPATAAAQLMLVVGGVAFVHVGQVRGGDVGWLALLGMGQQGFGLTFFAAGARLIPAASMGLILLLESVLGSVWAWLGTAERPNAPTVVGGLVVIASVVVKLRDDGARATREGAVAPEASVPDVPL